MGKPFNIAETFGEALKNVPNSGTGRDQIEYIDEALISGDARNFYELSNLEELAANIELIGLQQPIRVRPDPDDVGGYLIVSGHRRMAAIRQYLKPDAPEKWAQIPCIVESGDGSPAMQELRLIYANADTRQLSSAEISLQVDRVRELLYELKDKEHVEFPGRMRDHVAEACKVSKSKIARLDAIKAGLAPDIAKVYWFSSGKDLLSESTAYELSKLDHDMQQRIIDRQRSGDGSIRYITAYSVAHIREDLEKLAKRTCKRGDRCTADGCVQHIINVRMRNHWSTPGCAAAKCCGTCSDLRTCKDACSQFAEKQKQLKLEHKEQAAQEMAAQAEKERPVIEGIKQMWARWDAARRQAGKAEEETFAAGTQYWQRSNIGLAEKIATGAEKLTTSSYSPYGYSRPSEYDALVKTARFLGCSTDYLLGLCPDYLGNDVPIFKWSPVGGYTPQRVPLLTRTPTNVGDQYRVAQWDGVNWCDPNNSAKVLTGLRPSEWLPLPYTGGFCRADTDAEGPAPAAAGGWISAETPPDHPCECVVEFNLGEGAGGSPETDNILCRWDGDQWCWQSGGAVDMPAIRWCEVPCAAPPQPVAAVSSATWISVDTSLPEPGVKVLVVDEDGDLEIDRRVSNGEWDFTGQYGVHHWLPIPEPPELAESDDGDDKEVDDE